MKRKLVWPVDQSLLVFTLLLLAFGLLMVFSSSAVMAEERFGSAFFFLKRQAVWDVVGLGALWVCRRVDYHRWQKFGVPLLIITIVLLAAVLAVGPVVKGARRWLHFGPLHFQPSEMAKLAVILWLSRYLDRHCSHLKSFTQGFLPPVAIMSVVCGLMVLEPDLGTPVLLFTVGCVMLYLAGAKLWHLGSLFGSALIPVTYLILYVPYRRRRLMSFLNPLSDPQGTGYQVLQSILAFGSGGLFGKGLGDSALKRLYLPDPHTDFIFPIIGEELGLVGCAFLIALFIAWGIRAWRVAARAPDLYGHLMAAGITTWILLQTLINMGVSCGVLPTKGLPMPFISFGGTSSVITLAAVGVLLNISSQAVAKIRKG